jgi:opacity protein-like surface antigen
MPQSFVRRSLVIASLTSLLTAAAHAQAVSKATAVGLAETFIARNGYTNLPRDQVRPDLDPESLDWGGSREKELDRRFNTLNPNAIGVKKGVRGKQNGWSIAFDYVGGGQNSRTCRVVTMDEDGTNLTVQHVDGIRSYFAGFD